PEGRELAGVGRRAVRRPELVLEIGLAPGRPEVGSAAGAHDPREVEGERADGAEGFRPLGRAVARRHEEDQPRAGDGGLADGSDRRDLARAGRRAVARPERIAEEEPEALGEPDEAMELPRRGLEA